MTPFGAKIREMRAARGLSLKEMAEDLGVSPSYLSALEHGHRGRPTWSMIQRIIGYFNVIWDEAEELARLAQVSHPKITIDTAGLDPRATELANLLKDRIAELDRSAIEDIITLLGSRNTGSSR